MPLPPRLLRPHLPGRGRSRVSEIIKNEDHAHPLSDDKIAKILKGEGTSISRRTVAKYRQQLGIPDSRLRTYL